MAPFHESISEATRVMQIVKMILNILRWTYILFKILEYFYMCLLMIINDIRRLIYPLGLALELKIILAPPEIHDGGAGRRKS